MFHVLGYFILNTFVQIYNSPKKKREKETETEKKEKRNSDFETDALISRFE